MGKATNNKSTKRHKKASPKAKTPKKGKNTPKRQKRKNTKKTRHKNKSNRVLTLCMLTTLVLLLATALVIFYQTLFARIHQNEQTLTIDEGQSYYSLIPSWDNKLPLFSPTVAKLYIKTQVQSSLNAGDYTIPKNPSFFETLNVLQQGKVNSSVIKIQIIEGKRASDLYELIKNTPDVKIDVLDNNPTQIKNALAIEATTPDGALQHNLEGWFAPDTYIYAKGTSDKAILTDLYKRQKKILDAEWQSRDSNLPYKSAYEALIMASIIEKETGLVEERPLIAGVFINRLNKGMRLQTDPTIIYGMGDRYKGDIRRQDIQEKTAYNTYQIDGLPPTPIALPSKAAIHAALHPADTEALFFVATGKGGHKFSKTLQEHNKAVQEYLAYTRQHNN